MQNDKRAYPRHCLCIPVDVKMKSRGRTLCFGCDTVSISRNTIEIGADTLMVKCLMAQEELPRTCEVELSVPERQGRFSLPCQVITHRRLSQHRYVVVMTFSLTGDAEKTLLEDFLEQARFTGDASTWHAGHAAGASRVTH